MIEEQDLGVISYADPLTEGLPTLLREPRRYQWEGIRAITDALKADPSQGFLLGDDMGLGKSLQAIYSLAALGDRALIMCPAGVLFNWVGELFATHPTWTVCVFADRTPPKRLRALFGENAKRFVERPDKADMLVMSYDAAKRCVCGNPDPISSAKETHKMVCLPAHEAMFRDRVFVGDELHLAKNPSAARTQAALAVARVCKSVIALTGTAVANKPVDLWTLLSACKIEAAAVGTYGHFHRAIRNGAWDTIYQGLTQSGRFMRRLKKDVLTELPPKIRQDWLLSMTPRQQMDYENLRTVLKRKVKTDNKKSGAHILAILSRMQTLANSVKEIPIAEKCAERAEEGLHTVVASCRTEPLWEIRSMLLDKGIVAEVLDGGTPKDDRKRICDAYNAGNIQVVLTTLAEGVNLVRGDMVILLDCDWTYSKVCQREDRAHRIGQVNHVQIVRVIAADIDRRKIDLVVNKKLVTHAVLDGGDTSDANDHVVEAVVTALIDEDAA